MSNLNDLAVNTAYKVPFSTTEWKTKLEVIQEALKKAYNLGLEEGYNTQTNKQKELEKTTMNNNKVKEDKTENSGKIPVGEIVWESEKAVGVDGILTNVNTDEQTEVRFFIPKSLITEVPNNSKLCYAPPWFLANKSKQLRDEWVSEGSTAVCIIEDIVSNGGKINLLGDTVEIMAHDGSSY